MFPDGYTEYELNFMKETLNFLSHLRKSSHFFVLLVVPASKKNNYLDMIEYDFTLAEFVQVISFSSMVSARAILRQCDIFMDFSLDLLPPHAIYEAMSIGIPVIGMNSSVTYDLVGETSGILLKPSNEISSMSKLFQLAVQKLLENESVRVEMSLNSRSKVGSTSELETLSSCFQKALCQAQYNAQLIPKPPNYSQTSQLELYFNGIVLLTEKSKVQLLEQYKRENEASKVRGSRFAYISVGK